MKGVILQEVRFIAETHHSVVFHIALGNPKNQFTQQASKSSANF
jgi:hypothetical protein